MVFFFTALLFAVFFGELNLRWAVQQPLFRIRDISVFCAVIEMIGTSIGRYHYMLISFILLTAVILLPGNDRAGAFERGDRQ